MHGDELGDADHRHDPRVDGLVDRIGREARRHEDERRIRVGLLDRIHDRVEHWDAFDILAALAGRDAGNDVRAVALVAQAVEAALAAREALDDEPRVGVDDDRHYFGTPLRTRVGSGMTPSPMRSPSSSRTRAASSPTQSTRASHGAISSGRSR